MLNFLGVVGGLLLLIGGGTLLVRGASELAARFGVSPMIVGLTIVSFGTSAPELMVNALGAMRGETALAFGNVVGSNISNLGLVLGLAALIAPIRIQGDIVRREVPLLLLATTAITVMALDGPLEGMPSAIGRTDAIILLLLFSIFIYIMAHDFLVAQKSDQFLLDIADNPRAKESGVLHWSLGSILLGCCLLYFGGEMTVENGTELARRFGVSPTIIGLYVVAIGTSMPELVTSVIAAMRGESDLALGNVIGSNIFNSLFVLPISGLIAQIPIPAGGIVDLGLSWLLAAVLIPIFLIGKAKLTRLTGAMILLLYIGYAVYRFASEA